MATHDDALLALITATTGCNKKTAEQLWDNLMEAAFAQTIADGQFRLPRGLGALYIKLLKPTRRKLPNGEWIERDDLQPMVRYREGLSVRLALGKGERYANRVNEKKPLRTAEELLSTGDD